MRVSGYGFDPKVKAQFVGFSGLGFTEIGFVFRVRSCELGLELWVFRDQGSGRSWCARKRLKCRRLNAHGFQVIKSTTRLG